MPSKTSDNDTPTPPFSLRDAERIVRRLAPALQQHGAWIRRIHSMLACRTAPHPDDLEPDGHLRSDFGRWLNEETNEYILSHPEYRAASEYHRKVHDVGRELCEAVKSGGAVTPKQFEAFSSSVDLLDSCLDVLVKELWDLLRYTDPLTGISTRYAMLPRLKQELDRVHRTGHPCSICMVDLDLFKAINDAHGHDAGDRVLEAVSNYLLVNLRRYDQVYRYGGEEFVLMFPNTSPESALPIVDRLRHGLEEMDVDLGNGRTVRVTASFGIAPLDPGQSVRDSIANADRSMYAAKQAGRNKVCVWRPGPR
jgi:diguanylate cyclase (GGDEF)-like protein